MPTYIYIFDNTVFTCRDQFSDSYIMTPRDLVSASRSMSMCEIMSGQGSSTRKNIRISLFYFVTHEVALRKIPKIYLGVHLNIPEDAPPYLP